MSVNLWTKDSGNLLSHSQGLTEEQVQFLQSLKKGDRLIIWKNNTDGKTTASNYTLKKYMPRPVNTSATSETAATNG